MMSVKGREFARTCRLCAVLVFSFGVAASAGLSETLQLPDQGETSSGGFFRDKFACARWVEEKAADLKCLECHAAIVQAEELPSAQKDGSPSGVMMIHAQHMRSGKVSFTCLACHKEIDPYQTSSAGLRNQVSANMCFKCHFPHGQE